jgi:hypothetical protein
MAELRWTVALEAALCFSFTTWWLAVDRAWPGSNPCRFALTVLVGASTATLLCHVVPSLCADTLSTLLKTPVGRVMQWPVRARFCAGAAAWLLQLARTSGGLFVRNRNLYFPNELLWTLLANSIALTWILVSFAIPRRQRPLIALALFIGVGLTVASFAFQSRGLVTANPRVITEERLDHPYSVAKGMLIAAAPATIMALRIGRMGLPSRAIWWTALCGVWAPVAVSVTLMSLSKMAGARLYWQPSLPIGFIFAISWLMGGKATLWPLALTVLAPCLIYAIWIRDLTKLLNARWHKLAAYAVIGIAAFKLTEPDLWSGYYLVWLWSVVAANLALCLASLGLRWYHKPDGNAAPQSNPHIP